MIHHPFQPLQQFGGGNMAWGSFTAYGTGNLDITEGSMNGKTQTKSIID